ncbi:MAG: class IV adenylate cyclase [Sulfurovum sp.]|nr:MAG: class IV adenylate cyclase [Sulfurovum sp.]
MNEVEVKIKVQNIDNILNKLNSLGCALTSPKKQRDVIFISSDMKEYKITAGTVVLRTRNENGKESFTLKRQSGVNLSSKEYNLEIKGANTLHEMLKLMGFKQLVEVVKVRMEGKLDKYSICIDEVEKLGTFIELELLTDREDFNNIQKEMITFLKKMGMDTSQRSTIPYDTQIFNLNHSFKELDND